MTKPIDGQGDLFALLDRPDAAPETPKTPREGCEAKKSDGDHRDAWRAEIERMNALVAEKRDAGRIERLAWGEASPTPLGKCSCTKGAIAIDYFEHEGRWFSKRQYSFGSSGGGGPFSECDGITSREDFILSAMRRELRGCAHSIAMKWHDPTGAKEAERVAAWAIGQCPPLMFGADLAQEFEQLTAKAIAEEEERHVMLKDVEAKRDALLHAWREASGMEPNPKCSDWHNNTYGGMEGQLLGDVQIQGLWPDQLRVTVYSCGPRYGSTEEPENALTGEQMEALRSSLERLQDVPVMVAPLEMELAHYYPVVRRKVTRRCDQFLSQALRDLRMEGAAL